MPKLISLSSADKNKENPVDHEISVEDATKMVAKFDTRVRKLIEREYKQPPTPNEPLKVSRIQRVFGSIKKSYLK